MSIFSFVFLCSASSALSTTKEKQEIQEILSLAKSQKQCNLEMKWDTVLKQNEEFQPVDLAIDQ